MYYLKKYKPDDEVNELFDLFDSCFWLLVSCVTGLEAR